MKKIEFVITLAALLCVTVFVTGCAEGTEADTETSAFESEPPITNLQIENGQVIPPTLIAHAGGAYHGLCYTNTKEALDISYLYGHRFFEVDFIYTIDGHLVLLHDWENIAGPILDGPREMTKEEFLAAEVLSGLTTMDVDALAVWMGEHPDAYIITDVKEREDNPSLLEELKVSLGDLSERLIPQAYGTEQWTELNRAGWDMVIMTTYGSGLTKPEIEEFALSNDIWALTMPTDMMDAEMLGRLSEAGVKVFTHTVNDLKYYEEWREAGLYGIYTDYFTPAGFPY